MTTRVYLHGALAEFGSRHDLDVRDAPEACRLLASQLPGFERTLRDGRWQIYRGPIEQGRTVDPAAADLALGRAGEIHVMPAAEGAGAVFDGIGSLFTTVFFGGLNLITGIFGGAQSANDSYADREKPEERPSFLFDGPTNTSTQGLPVPLVYGRMRAGSMVVSSGIAAEDIAIDGSAAGDNEGPPNTVVDDGAVTGNKGGGGKGGGGTQQVPTEEPNTLRSNATARVVDVVSEGPIVGLVNGWQSMYLDDTPVANEDESWNFEGITRSDRYGYPDQDPMPNQDSVETPYEVGTQITHDTPLVRTVNNIDADAVRVTVQTPNLSYQDPETGDLRGTSVQWAVDVRPAGGGWNVALTDTIEGKTTSPYQRSVRVRLPGEGPWDVRVRRVSEDDERSNLRNDIVWSSFVVLIDAKLVYPDTAAFGLQVNARQFGDTVPSRKYDIKGRIISVPSNYDPETRTYSGIWDGTLKDAWTDNPAWIYYDLATHPRYGAGIPYVDKAQLYRIARYCDELVDDGFGGREPRFTCNTVIADRSDAIDALTQLAQVFRGMTYWGDNSVMPVADMPSEPVKLVTPANVIDGAFEYAGAARSEQHSAWLVSYNDPDNNDRLTPEVVEDRARIQKSGWKPQEITAFGCSSRGQARRVGLWARESEVNEDESLSYQAAADHADIRPGDIIKQQDPNRAGARLSGRFTAVATDRLTLDRRPDDIDTGEVWYIDVVLPDNRLERKQITRWDGNTVTLKTALTQPPVLGAVWILASASVEPALWRVRENRETGAADGQIRYEITTTAHDPNKYARVEQGLAFDPPDNTLIPTGRILPPTNITAESYTYLAGGTQHQGLTVSLTPADDARVTRYIIEAKGPADAQWRTLSTSEQISADLRDADPGQYRVRARSVTGINQYSSYVYATVTAEGLLGPTPPDTIVVQRGTFSITLIPEGGQAGQSWQYYMSTAPLTGADEILSNATQIGGGASITATDLQPDTLYYFYVRGINVYGTSAFSPVQARTKNEPEAILKNISGQIKKADLFAALQENIDGLNDSQVLRITDGNLVAGFGAAYDEEQQTFDFGVAADRFFIAAVNGRGQATSTALPFVVDTQTGEVIADDALIRKLTFTKLVSGDGEILATPGGQIKAKYLQAEELVIGLANVNGAGSLAGRDTADWRTQIAGAGKPADNADVTGDNTSADTAAVDGESSGNVRNRANAGQSARDQIDSDVAGGTLESTTGAQGRADAARDAANDYTDNRLTGYVAETAYNADLSQLQSQIDGQIESHFRAYDPALNNAPASGWTTDAERERHLGDLFYNTESGHGWRFAKLSNGYSWLQIRDTGIQKALAEAAQAQDTADAKRRVFVDQPAPPYDPGDLWADGQTVLRSITTKTTSGSYAAADWQIIGDVTGQNTAADVQTGEGKAVRETGADRTSDNESASTRSGSRSGDSTEWQLGEDGSFQVRGQSGGGSVQINRFGIIGRDSSGTQTFSLSSTGRLTIQQASVIDTLQIASQAVTFPLLVNNFNRVDVRTGDPNDFVFLNSATVNDPSGAPAEIRFDTGFFAYAQEYTPTVKFKLTVSYGFSSTEYDLFNENAATNYGDNSGIYGYPVLHRSRNTQRRVYRLYMGSLSSNSGAEYSAIKYLELRDNT